MTVRDVTTVEHGEKVSVWLGAPRPTRLWGGVFMSGDSDGLYVDLGPEVAAFPWESSFWVEDSHGDVIRRIDPDPVLEGSPPELE